LNEVLPIKLSFYVEYVNTRSFIGDIFLILKTLTALVR
jgi:lipopolysaccharide/colanic/teichoic acid biosynthesis glycosyltransferase